MDPIRIIVAGPGRAGGSIGIAALHAGHDIVGVVPGPSGSTPSRLSPFVVPDGPLPDADLLLVATRDSQIEQTAADLALRCRGISAAAHLSGFTSVRALASLEIHVGAIGSLHPLQTLPDPESGAAALVGAWAAVTGPAGPQLSRFAIDLGMTPFPLADDSKPTYHAAASAAANFVVECLGVAEDLMASAGVPFEATRPLVEQIVRNVYVMGAERALTGPVARGDRSTVFGQVAAAAAVDGSLGDQYRMLVEALAIRAGRSGEFE